MRTIIITQNGTCRLFYLEWLPIFCIFREKTDYERRETGNNLKTFFQ